jgi:hypothetical protein
MCGIPPGLSGLLGFIYYVTLFFQNIEQWSALRTGLSWLFFRIPYFVVAQLGKRLARWLPVAWAVGSGCFIAAAGMLGMSQLKTTTPFSWPQRATSWWEWASA